MRNIFIMTLQSMTGFGKAERKYSDTMYSIEIRSLNSKQFDFNCRIPYRFCKREMEIRNVVNDKLIRGKIDLFIQKKTGTSESTTIDTELIKKYYRDLLPVFDEIKLNPDTNVISSLLRLPDVVRHGDEEPSEEEWALISDGVKEAISHLILFRTTEGNTIEKDILKNLSLISDHTDEIIPLSKERIPLIRQRLDQAVNEWSQNAESDKNRLEQELAFYIEKIDFNEEIQRLKQHCIYFIQTTKESGAGRKLGFITQELGREINTLGSKAYHSEIQKKVVEMKDALEKIKEQLLNVL